MKIAALSQLRHSGAHFVLLNKVTTPLMLVHGDLDFVPIQQDEEFFTMLYRQDKRVTFVRYQGEWHTIASHANVLDLWERIDNWLKETMASPG
jgi:dipeptidyl aminopeptidase/acylaminoacyl peptidase